MSESPRGSVFPVEHDPFASPNALGPAAQLADYLRTVSPGPLLDANALRRATQESMIPAPDPIADLSAQRRATPNPLELAIGLLGPRASFPLRAPITTSPAIRAYHGSPHDFERFDMSKVGTGEGAQVFGQGLYFAEKEAVARQYRDNFMAASGSYYHPHRIAADVLENAGGDHELAMSFLKADRDNGGLFGWRNGGAAWPEGKQAWQLLKERVELKPPARMYAVDIKADRDAFLDLDKKIGEQPRVVEALSQVPWVQLPRNVSDLGYLTDMAAKHGPDSWYAAQLNSIKAAAAKPGAEFTPRSGDAMTALAEAGIPGAKYLDQGSRRPFPQPDATHNYVVFDDKLIDIVKKYGIAGASTLTGLKFVPVDHDPFQETQ